MTTLNAIAELVWLRLSPDGDQSAPHSKHELVEAAYNIYAGLIWETYLQTQAQGERTIFESLLQKKEFDVERDGDKYVVNIGKVPVIELPRDAGIYIVREAGSNKRYIKGSLATSELFEPSSTGEKSYYRLSDRIEFPEGVYDTKRKVQVLMVAPEPDEYGKIQVSRIYAESIEGRLMRQYMPGVEIPEDKSTDENSNVK